MKHNEIRYGVVESRDDDPKKLGRCKVRVVGVHSEDNVLLPTRDLPWAYPMMPVHSASMSGIGYSPTGIVEGTWVVVSFRDVDMQQPIILGTIGGIPEDPNVLPTVDTVTYKVNRRDTLKDSNGNPVLDGSGAPVLTGPVVVETVTEAVVPMTDIRKPFSMTVSDAGIQFIMGQEALSSLVKGKNTFTKKVVDPETIIYSYQDSGGVWTIGYGSTLLPDGSKVGPDTQIFAKDAKSLLNKHVTEQIEKQLRGKLVAPVTQQMYDALIDMAYNGGVYGLMSSDVFSSVNTGKYKDAAALIPFWRNTVGGKPNKGVQNRRSAQQALFMSGGIPNSSFTDVEKDATPIAPSIPPTVSTTVTTGETTVDRIVTSNDAKGFKDPNGRYPTKTLINEPDTHRLARSDRIYESIVFAKEAARVKHVRKALWIKRKLEWSQPEIPYNAKYPFNQTRVTESGHVEEWDDTKDSERIHQYHRAGTYSEIDRNGSRINRIVGDSYEIMERDGNVVIKGACNVTIIGDSNIRVENDAYLEVLGNMKTRVGGDYELRVKGEILLHSEGPAKIESFQDVYVHADGNMTLEAVGNITESAEKIDLNPGGPPSPIKTPEEWEERTERPTFGDLIVITRTAEDNVNYESPSEGDSTIYRENAIARGDLNLDDSSTPPAEPISVSPAAPPPLDIKKTPTVPVDVANIGDISLGMQLSPNYKLSNVAKDIPKDQAGMTAQQMVGNLKWIANNVLEPIRAQFPNLVLTSGWRSEGANKGIVGASKKSDHLIGAAIDMQFTGFNPAKTFEAAKAIQAMLPTYNQILVEYKGSSMWIHVAVYGPDFGKNNQRRIGTLDVIPNKFTEGSFVLLR